MLTTSDVRAPLAALPGAHPDHRGPRGAPPVLESAPGSRASSLRDRWPLRSRDSRAGGGGTHAAPVEEEPERQGRTVAVRMPSSPAGDPGDAPRSGRPSLIGAISPDCYTLQICRRMSVLDDLARQPKPSAQHKTEKLTKARQWRRGWRPQSAPHWRPVVRRTGRLCRPRQGGHQNQRARSSHVKWNT